MSEWIEYTGSDEQIALIKLNFDGLLWKNTFGYLLNTPLRTWFNWKTEEIRDFLKQSGVTHILLCKRHDLSEMICQQAKTGQPVWVRTKSPRDSNKLLTYKTSKPNWYLPDAEYSFDAFKD